MSHRLATIRHVVLDMDGTIYLDGVLFDATLPFLAMLERLGIGCTFVTNNCGHSRAEYVNRLQTLGIHAAPEAVVTSSHATAWFLRQEWPDVRRLHVLGSSGSKDDLRLAGYEVVEDNPEAVVVGYDAGLTYEALCRAAWYIKQGLPFIATHPDRVCPTNSATVLPDCGAICALLATATGRAPDAIPGKPQPAMLHEVMARHQLRPEEVAMVGDRLYTDVRMALDAGALAVLTLTGEADEVEANAQPAAHRPDLIVSDLADFADRLVAARK